MALWSATTMFMAISNGSTGYSKPNSRLLRPCIDGCCNCLFPLTASSTLRSVICKADSTAVISSNPLLDTGSNTLIPSFVSGGKFSIPCSPQKSPIVMSETRSDCAKQQ